MSGLRIHLSNRTCIVTHSADAAEIESIIVWFTDAQADDVLLLEGDNRANATRIQKRHVVEIESIS